MENKQLLEMASADGLYINGAEACMVLDWTVFFYGFFFVNLFLFLHASANHCLPEGVNGGDDECC
jgi:hypothetical protein